MDGTIIVADDDRTIRTVLTQALTRAGCKVHSTSSLTTLMRWVSEGRGDVVISDVVMPDGNGLEMLPKIHEDRPDLPVIIISAQNTIMTAIQAKEAEAFDYLPKPFDLPDLMKRTARALEARSKSSHENRALPSQPDELPLVGRGIAMQELYRMVAGVINMTIPVLIHGESGTGKTLLARSIHDASDRRSLPFVPLTEAHLREMDGPERLLSEANGGSVLIKEVADLELEDQARLVRMIDHPSARLPRFIATTQQDLKEAVHAGDFRKDLFYRLSGVNLYIPALRDRVDDIALLVEHFMTRSERGSEGGHWAGMRQSPPMMSQEALAAMRNYSWPGNVRQLENAVHYLALAVSGDEISAAEVELALGGVQNMGEPLSTQAHSGDLSASVAAHLKRYFDLHTDELPPAGLYQRVLADVELPLIELALDATGGNQAKCADLLGINRNTLRKKITTLGIEVTRRSRLM